MAEQEGQETVEDDERENEARMWFRVAMALLVVIIILLMCMGILGTMRTHQIKKEFVNAECRFDGESPFHCIVYRSDEEGHFIVFKPIPLGDG